MARCDRSNGRGKGSVRGLAGNRKVVPEVCTPLSIATVKREFGVGYSNTGCWELLRSLGLSSQKPAKHALQRDEEAIVTCRGKTRAGAHS
jgi:transposase